MKILKRKVSFLLMFLILAGPLEVNSQYLNDITLKNNNSYFADLTKKKIKLSYKSPLAAGSLSFLLPGLSLGQLYNGDYTGFAIHFGISVGIFMFTLIAAQNKWYELPLMNMSGSNSDNGGKNEWIFTLCLLSYMGNWLWSTIDAVHFATLNNREIERQIKTGYNNIRLNFAPGIGRNNKPNLNISVYF